MDKIVELLKALSDETRFNIVNLLLSHDLCVGALARRLNISKPAVSQHLQILRKAGLVRGEKRGYYTHYTVERDVLNDLSQAIKAMSLKEPVKEGGCNKNIYTGHHCYDK